MKRFLIFFLAFTVTFCSLSVPAYAAETGVDQETEIDLLGSGRYDLTLWISGKANTTYNIGEPSWDMTGANAAVFYFHPTLNYGVNRIEIKIRSDRQPANIKLFSGDYSIQLTSQGSTQDNIYTYTAVVPHLLLDDNAHLTINYSSSHGGRMGIESFSAYADDRVSISPSSWFIDGAIYNTEFSDEFIGYINIDNQLPVEAWYQGPIDQNTDNTLELRYGHAFVTLPGTSKSYDYYTMTVFHVGELHEFGATLKATDGNYVSLKTEVMSSSSSQAVIDFDEYSYRINVSQVVIYTQGYNLSGKSLQFNYKVMTVPASNTFEYAFGLFTQVVDIEAGTYVSSLPWYVNLFNFLYGQFNSVVSSIASVGSKIDSFSNNVSSYHSEILAALQSNNSAGGFQSLLNKLQELYDQQDSLFGGLQVTLAAMQSVFDTSLQAIIDNQETMMDLDLQRYEYWKTQIYGFRNAVVNALSSLETNLVAAVEDVTTSVIDFQTELLRIEQDRYDYWKDNIWGFRNAVENSITALQTAVINYLTSFQTSVSTAFTNQYNLIVAKFNALHENLNWNFNRIINILNSSGDNDSFQNDVEDQGDKLDQMDDVLGSVTMPALNSIDTDLSGIVASQDLTNIAHVYTFVIDDNFMAPLMTMVCIMAMMSFVLFGKR